MTVNKRERRAGAGPAAVTVSRPARVSRLDCFTTVLTRNGNSRRLVEAMARLETSEPGSCPLYTCCTHNQVNRIYDCGGIWIDGGIPCIAFVERLDIELGTRDGKMK